MPTGTFILTEGDDADTPMSNVVFLNRPELGDPLSIGDLAAFGGRRCSGQAARQFCVA